MSSPNSPSEYNNFPLKDFESKLEGIITESVAKKIQAKGETHHSSLPEIFLPFEGLESKIFFDKKNHSFTIILEYKQKNLKEDKGRLTKVKNFLNATKEDNYITQYDISRNGAVDYFGQLFYSIALGDTLQDVQKNY